MSAGREQRGPFRVIEGGRCPTPSFMQSDDDSFPLWEQVVAPEIAVDRKRLELMGSALVAARCFILGERYDRCDEAIEAVERLIREILDERQRSPNPGGAA